MEIRLDFGDTKPGGIVLFEGECEIGNVNLDLGRCEGVTTPALRLREQNDISRVTLLLRVRAIDERAPQCQHISSAVEALVFRGVHVSGQEINLLTREGFDGCDSEALAAGLLLFRQLAEVAFAYYSRLFWDASDMMDRRVCYACRSESYTPSEAWACPQHEICLGHKAIARVGKMDITVFRDDRKPEVVLSH